MYKENKKLYTWIRIERENRKLSQSKLSQLTGFSQLKLSEWELNKNIPSQEQQEIIRTAFKKYDEMANNGTLSNFLKKTRWSKEYKNSKVKRKKRKSILLKDVEKFAKSLKHNDKSHERFKPRPTNSLGINSISLFGGCGGFSLGVHQAGVNILANVEIEESARNVYHYNFPSVIELGHDIKSIDNDRIESLNNELPDIDIVFGGPPCQGFSLTGKRDIYDPRNQLYNEFARFVHILKPKIFIIENVRLLTSMKTPSGKLLLDDLVNTFESLGYQIGHQVLNAQNYGVPQFRERLFIIGLSKLTSPKKTITFPKPTNFLSESTPLFDNRDVQIKTLRNSIGDLEELESGEKSLNDPLHFAVSHPGHVIEMLKDVPQGSSAHQNSDPALKPKSGYNTTYKRLVWNEPSSTISTTFGMISGSRNVHPTSTRSLTIREALRCQSFPDDFVVFGSLGQVRTMIGNSVPPTLAYNIASHIVQEYF